MIELNEPQVWTLIGVFAASTFAMLGWLTGSFTRVLRAEIGGVNARIDGLRGEMSARFERVDEQFRRVDDRLDHLDRDVQALARKVFDRPE
ncbi:MULTISPECIES: hypothetical protein [unclassified Aeromicrobium]|uniref:hypothetical protein n=1 Tax=unclassified Aeromicrobium TaxID=2633570 RepID=UPI00396B2E1F